MQVEAALWVVGAFFVIYYTNVVKVMFSHKGVNKLFLDLFLMTFGINTVIIFYVAFILPLRGIEDYEDYLGRRVTYVATICGVLGFIR